MASYLAGLNDVNFKKDQRPDAGPLEALSGTQYAINTHKYPADVGGSLDKGHYVTFFVNSQKRTQFATNLAQNLGDDLPTIVKNRKFMESMRGAMHCARTMLAKEGFLSFYSGVGTAVVKSAVTASIAYPLYSHFRRAIGKQLGDDDLHHV